MCTKASLPPPSGSQYAFRFTGVIDEPDATEVQLAEVKLYGVGGQELTVLQTTNPGGAPLRWWDSAPSATDGDISTKWLDLNFTKPGGVRESTLLLTLASAIPVASYDLFTAGSPRGRDPTEWVFGVYRGGQIEALHSVTGLQSPIERYASYTN